MQECGVASARLWKVAMSDFLLPCN